MKTRRSRQSFGPPPTPKRRKPRRKSLKKKEIMTPPPPPPPETIELSDLEEGEIIDDDDLDFNIDGNTKPVIDDKKMEEEETEVISSHEPEPEVKYVDIIEDDEIQVVDVAETPPSFNQSKAQTRRNSRKRKPKSNTPSFSNKSLCLDGCNIVANPLAQLSLETAGSLRIPQSSNSGIEAEEETETKKEVTLIDIADDSDIVAISSQESNNCNNVFEVDNDGDDEVEVLAVVSPPNNNRQNKRPSLTRRQRASLALIERKQNQNGNLSGMQGSIQRAKKLVRQSLSKNTNPKRYFAGPDRHQENVWTSIAPNSRQIGKRNKNNRNRRNKLNKRMKRLQQEQAQHQIQQQQHPPQKISMFNRNRSREFNRERIFIPGPDKEIPDNLTFQVNNLNPFVQQLPSAPEFIPLDSSTPLSKPFLCQRFNQMTDLRRKWIPLPNNHLAPSPIAPGSNIMSVGTETEKPKGTLRPIIIDGSNVAIGHGKVSDERKAIFSSRGLEICIDYFLKRGHNVIAFAPQFRLKRTECSDPDLLEKLEKKGLLRLTPSREVGGKRITSYDDLFILQYAHEVGGVIVSNDHFRDVYRDQPHLRDTITNRILQYLWITQDTLMFPQDPMGRVGISLDSFLQF